MVINHWLSGVLHVAISFVAADACPRLQVLQWRALGEKKMAIWRDPFWATSPEMCHTHIHTSYIYIYVIHTHVYLYFIYAHMITYVGGKPIYRKSISWRDNLETFVDLFRLPIHWKWQLILGILLRKEHHPPKLGNIHWKLGESSRNRLIDTYCWCWKYGRFPFLFAKNP